MVCALCHYLACDGQDIRDAVTVAAGYATCEQHLELAEIIGKADGDHGTLGLSVLDGDSFGDCGRCGRFLGTELGALAGPGQAALCISCAGSPNTGS